MGVGLDGPKRFGVNTLRESSLKNVSVGASCGIRSAKRDGKIVAVASVQIHA